MFTDANEPKGSKNERHIANDSHNDGQLLDDEPPQFRKLRPSDRRFLKELDAATWKLQKQHDCYGMAACMLVLFIIRRPSRLPVRPSGSRSRHCREQTSQHLKSEPSISNSSYGVRAQFLDIGRSIIGAMFLMLASDFLIFRHVTKRMQDSPISKRLDEAFDSDRNSWINNAVIKHRWAWWKCQTKLGVAERVWYRLRYSYVVR